MIQIEKKYLKNLILKIFFKQYKMINLNVIIQIYFQCTQMMMNNISTSSGLNQITLNHEFS